MLTDTQRKLAEDNLRLAHQLVKERCRRARRYARLSPDVLESCAHDSVVMAAGSYEEEKGAFGSHLAFQIHSQMADALRHAGVCLLPRSYTRQSKSCSAKVKALAGKVSRGEESPRDDEEHPCERLAGKSTDPLADARWAETLSALDPLEAKVIDGFFRRGETIGEIASGLNLSFIATRRLKKAACDRLREVLQPG